MPNDDFTIICPYYYKAIGKEIFCEGISGDPNIPIEKSQIKQSFIDRQSRNDCLREYCASFRFPNCRIAAMQEAFYGTKVKP